MITLKTGRTQTVHRGHARSFHEACQSSIGSSPQQPSSISFSFSLQKNVSGIIVSYEFTDGINGNRIAAGSVINEVTFVPAPTRDLYENQTRPKVSKQYLYHQDLRAEMRNFH